MSALTNFLHQLYKQYASVPFIELFRHERSQRPVSSSLLAGLPSFVLNRVLRQVTFSSTTVKKSTWYAAYLFQAEAKV